MTACASYDPSALGARCTECPLGPGGDLRAAMGRAHGRPEPRVPVPPEVHPQRGTGAPRHAEVALVGQQPGPDEVRDGGPFRGKAGIELTRSLAAIGRHRTEVDLFNLLACSCPGPAGGAWARMEAVLRRLNAERAERGTDPMPHPAECCRPRLDRELAPYRLVVTLGSEAWKALSGSARNILAVHGELLGRDSPGAPWRPYDPSGGASLPLLRLVPTVHPSFVLRAPAWRDTYRRELAKAFRYLDGRLNWTEPDVVYQPGPDELGAWLSVPVPFVSFDLETDGKEPLECAIRCFSFASPDLDGDGAAVDYSREAPVRVARAIGVNLLSGDGRTRFYPPDEEAEIVRIVACFLSNPANMVVGANLGYFDAAVVRRRWGAAIANVNDLLLAARFRAPDLPKGLKPNGRLFTDIGRWESDEKGEEFATATGTGAGEIERRDGERVAYCCLDTVVGCRVATPLFRAARENGAFDECPAELRPASWPSPEPFDTWAVDHRCQARCREMHRVGIYVDQAERAALAREYAVRASRRLGRITAMLADLPWVAAPPDVLLHGFNPNSADQFRALLYDYLALGMPPGVGEEEFLTDSGQESTSGKILRAHLVRADLEPVTKRFLRDTMLFRRETTKILGTVLAPLVPGESSLVSRDGRVHPTWNAHVVAPGRLSCANPNVQNQVKRAGMKRLRRVYRAAPGHIFLAGDLKQAHLRIIANTWRVPSLRDALLARQDAYLPTTVALFGRDDMLRGGWSGDLGKKPADGSPAATLRQAGKTFLLSSLYAARPETKQLVIASTEDEELGADGRPTGDTRFPYLDIDVPTVARWDDAWHAAEPGWKRAWESCMARYATNGNRLREPVLGRQSGSLNDGELNDVVNYETLAAEASLVRLVEERLCDAFPFDCDGPGTGLVANTHDGLVVEVADRGEEENARRLGLLRECMDLGVLPVLGWDVPIEAEVFMGYTLADLG